MRWLSLCRARVLKALGDLTDWTPACRRHCQPAPAWVGVAALSFLVTTLWLAPAMRLAVGNWDGAYMTRYVYTMRHYVRLVPSVLLGRVSLGDSLAPPKDEVEPEFFGSSKVLHTWAAIPYSVLVPGDPNPILRVEILLFLLAAAVFYRVFRQYCSAWASILALVPLFFHPPWYELVTSSTGYGASALVVALYLRFYQQRLESDDAGHAIGRLATLHAFIIVANTALFYLYLSTAMLELLLLWRHRRPLPFLRWLWAPVLLGAFVLLTRVPGLFLPDWMWMPWDAMFAKLHAHHQYLQRTHGYPFYFILARTLEGSGLAFCGFAAGALVWALWRGSKDSRSPALAGSQRLFGALGLSAYGSVMAGLVAPTYRSVLTAGVPLFCLGLGLAADHALAIGVAPPCERMGKCLRAGAMLTILLVLSTQVMAKARLDGTQAQCIYEQASAYVRREHSDWGHAEIVLAFKQVSEGLKDWHADEVWKLYFPNATYWLSGDCELGSCQGVLVVDVPSKGHEGLFSHPASSIASRLDSLPGFRLERAFSQAPDREVRLYVRASPPLHGSEASQAP